jgi:hypothetical protein
MLKRLLIAFTASVLFLYQGIGQTKSQNILKKIKIGADLQLLMGGDMQSPFDFLQGIVLDYELYQKKDMKVGVTQGFASDLSLGFTKGLGLELTTQGSKLTSFDTQLYIALRKSRVISPYLSVGVHNTRESHIVTLIEGNKTWGANKWGMVTMVGVNLKSYKRVSTSLYIRNHNNAYSALGVNVKVSIAKK